MRIIDRNVQRGRNKTQKQFEIGMWEKLSFASLAIVSEVEDKSAKVKLIPSFSYEDYDMKKGYRVVNTDNEKVDCLLVQDLNLLVGDVVLVVFTDLDPRPAINDLRNGRKRTDNYNIQNPVYHNSNFGIIINKVII